MACGGQGAGARALHRRLFGGVVGTGLCPCGSMNETVGAVLLLKCGHHRQFGHALCTVEVWPVGNVVHVSFSVGTPHSLAFVALERPCADVVHLPLHNIVWAEMCLHSFTRGGDCSVTPLQPARLVAACSAVDSCAHLAI